MPSDSDDVEARLNRVAAHATSRDLVADLLYADLRRELLHLETDSVSIGRFKILKPLGSGGMGTVFVAYDPTLEREVALKLIHFHGERDRQRMLSEARSLAKLRHDGIVKVFEVEAEGQEIYLAMELIEGMTLEKKLEESPSWRELARIFELVTVALAAAHKANIVHGDIKPANIMLDQDGSVRIVDFGLSTEMDSVEDVQLAGTPGYIAPELFEGERFDVKSDVYALLVSMRVCLNSCHAPKAWQQFVDVAIAAPASERPELTQVGAVLRKLRHRKRKVQRLGAGLLLLSMSAGGAFLLSKTAPSESKQKHCERGAGAVQRTWQQSQTAIHSRFQVSEWGGALGASPRLEQRLADYASAYELSYQASCRETFVAGQQSEAYLEKSRTCFAGHAKRFDVLVQELVDGDEAVLKRALVAAFRLPHLSDCRDHEYLSAKVPWPDDPEQRKQVVLGYERISEYKTLLALGQDKKGRPLAEALVEDVRTLAYQPLLAESLMLLFRFESNASRESAQMALLEEASVAASLGKSDDLLATIWTSAMISASNLGNFDRAAEYGERAELACARLGESASHRVSLMFARGIVHQAQGGYQEAKKAFEESLNAQIALHGPSEYTVARYHARLATVYLDMGEPVNALAETEKAIGILEATVGAQHPETGSAYHGKGGALVDLGRRQQAVSAYEAALAIMKREYGDVHLGSAITLGSLGMVRLQLRDFVGARKDMERSLAIKMELLPKDSTHFAFTYEHLGLLAQEEGNYQAAETSFRTALRIRLLTVEETSPAVAQTRIRIGTALSYLGREEEAGNEFRQANRVLLEVMGADKPLVVWPWLHWGLSLMNQQRCADALPLYQRVLDNWGKSLPRGDSQTIGVLLNMAGCHFEEGNRNAASVLVERAFSEMKADDDAQRGRGHFLQAKMATDPEVALTLAKRALSDYEGVLSQDQLSQDQQTEIRTWIRKHE